MEASRCPTCGEEPYFLDHLEKWYCYECNSYVDDGVEHVHEVDEEHEETPSEPTASLIAAELSDLESEDAQIADASEGEPTPPMEMEPTVEAPQPTVEIRMCPACDQPLKYIEKYDRYYCYSCKKYAPVEKKAEEPPKTPAPKAEVKMCPVCETELQFVDNYNEWYCSKCRKYPLYAKKKAEVQMKNSDNMPKEKPADACPKCGGSLKYIEKYERHYCHECKEYAPKSCISGPKVEDKKTCPKCESELKFIAQYNEWYCYKCKKYPLRPSKPILLL
jgi:ribosomal protein S27AE